MGQLTVSPVQTRNSTSSVHKRWSCRYRQRFLLWRVRAERHLFQLAALLSRAPAKCPAEGVGYTTVLQALTETEQALASYASELYRWAALMEAQQKAQRAFSMAYDQFLAGALSKLELFTTEQSLVSAADAALVQNQIAALGGGWNWRRRAYHHAIEPAGALWCHGALIPHPREETNNELEDRHSHNPGRREDFLQGLGERAADRILPWLATVVG